MFLSTVKQGAVCGYDCGGLLRVDTTAAVQLWAGARALPSLRRQRWLVTAIYNT